MRLSLVSAATVVAMTSSAFAQGEVNVYSSRHYDTDDTLYNTFTEQTGIEVNRIEDKSDALISRIQSEGELSPADVFISVDISRIKRAADAGILQPLNVDAVDRKVPAALHSNEDLWAGISTRVRTIFYDKEDVSNPPQTYQALADPEYEGMVCTRSSSNVYMNSLMASIIAHHGEDAARSWAEGVMNNFAREPQGGDTDQLRGIISGECEIALTNHYYFARGLEREVSGLTDGIDQIGIVWANQDTTGTHQNISGVGIVESAPNADNARALITYFLSETAQKLLADGNNEFPVVAGVAPSEPVLSMGTDFNRDDIDLSKGGGSRR